MKNVHDDGDVYDEVGQVAKESFEVAENSCYGVTNTRVTGAIKGGESASNKKVMVMVFIFVIALLLCTISACVAFTVKIFELQSEITTLKTQSVSALEFKLDMLQEESIQNFSLLESRTQHLLGNGLSPSTSAISCTALPPSSPSGYYWVRASNGSAVRVYCDMTRSCGGVTGGWMRVADLDMTNSSHQCPRGLQQRTDAGRRTCIPMISPGCSSVNFSAAEGYSRVCGKIIGYQVGDPDTFGFYSNPTIDSYIDGVSLTHGQPRQHIWSFAAGLDEVGSLPQHNCPCTNLGTAVPPPFVGNDYFCDTGSKQRFQLHVFYNEDPLWDGAGCGPLNTCCSFNNPPWVHKLLPQPTTDDIEMRVCKNDPGGNEDIAIETIELLVQ